MSQIIQTLSPRLISSVSMLLPAHASDIRPSIHQVIVDGRWHDGKSHEENLAGLLGAYYLMTNEERAPLSLDTGFDIGSLREATRGDLKALRADLDDDDVWFLVPVPRAGANTDRILGLHFSDAGSLQFRILDLHDQEPAIEVDWQDVVEQTAGDLTLFWDLFVTCHWQTIADNAEEARVKRLPAGSGTW